MLVSIPPKLSVSQFMGYLKGKSSLMIFDRPCQFEVSIRKSEILVGCRGFYVDTVGRKKEETNTEYIRNQLKEDYMGDQLTLFEEGNMTHLQERKIRRNKEILRISE